MDLLQRIINCEPDEVDKIVAEAIKEIDAKAQQVGTLGFLNGISTNKIFKGFIPLNTRIRYSNNGVEDYGMGTTDFIYEFAHFIKQYGMDSKRSIIYFLENFINYYFGFAGKTNRETIFNDIAWQTTKTDDEYFAALEKNEIGHLKGKGAAMCTERSALAEQILSLFGAEVYYCMGCVNHDGKEEPHCFNILKTKTGYALLDYSLPVTLYNQDNSVSGYFPFVANLTEEEFQDFINNGTIRSFDDYCRRNNQYEKTGSQRQYVVGKFSMEQEMKNGHSK